MHKLLSKPNNNTPFLCLFSSLSSLAHYSTRTYSGSSLSKFLVKTLTFSKIDALSISIRSPPTETLKKPKAVVQFLRQLGFSDAQIRDSVHLCPSILCADVDKTLKPKLQFFQDLGLTAPHLGNFISNHSHFLKDSLEETLIPCVDIIKKTLVNDKNNQALIQVLKWSDFRASEHASTLRCNIAFLESCGIVGSQLSMLLRSQPWLFFEEELALRNLVSRVVDMGFPIGSRRLAHALLTVSGISGETFNRKIELFQSFGFSEYECMEMIRRTPTLLGVSEGKLNC